MDEYKNLPQAGIVLKFLSAFQCKDAWKEQRKGQSPLDCIPVPCTRSAGARRHQA